MVYSRVCHDLPLGTDGNDLMFRPAPSNVSFPDLEAEVLRFWQDQKIYRRSQDQRRGGRQFVFYEGPPTANGLPHPGHCLTRSIKDLFPRYRTMRGDFCVRKAGWDTHGLPVEVEVCKELGIHSKEEIEAYGVEPFIQKCQQSVWRYMQQWERLTDRLGFWVDLDDAYVTYHQSYVESVWWCLKNLFDRGLLYQGHKIVWWWAQGGTALSAGEVGQGYREVADPSVYVRFPLADAQGRASDQGLLVWTTTPWTLPSNQFVAVHADLHYATVLDASTNQKLIVAESLVETLAEKIKRPLTVLETCTGKDLVGRRYLPPFDYYHAKDGQKTGRLIDGTEEPTAWRVISADFVTLDSGTGIVHQAPAFGEVDYDVLQSEQARYREGEGPELICAVGPDGRFTDEASPYTGRWVKECDKDISRELRQRQLLFHQEQYVHDYPFCWRADEDPLIQYPRRSWFVRTTQFRDQLLNNNRQINWMPEHIRDGRFGNFLESNVDWALSRERYWGTPLPIWVCDKTDRKEAINSYDELLGKAGVQGTDVWEKAKAAAPDLPDDLRVHKPYIDAVTYDSPFAVGARMHRVSEVIDCWFDSGAMPFAQWGYPHKGREEFESQFPADFISEAIDQTRGWFYSLLAISTLMFGDESSADDESSAADESAADDSTDDDGVPRHAFPHPYRNCIVLGLMLGEDGQKMSKQKRNYREPQEIFDRFGADALRWYFFANQAPWTSIRYSERAIKESIPEFLLRLWNVFSFFVIYANIDGFDPGERIAGDVSQLTPVELAKGKGFRPASERSELDRWILSELNRTAQCVIEAMDAYDNFAACGHLHTFVDGLSNWYVRRGRDRYWSSDKDSPDKLDAYWTLYECLLTSAKLIAPFTPFLADYLWRHLTEVFGQCEVDSVHLCDYPEPEPRAIDDQLSERMESVREISSLGRSARMNAKLKVRQPLARVEVILADTTHLDWLKNHSALIREELNVREVEFTSEAEQYIDYQVRPNFKRLGPRLGKLMPSVKKLLQNVDGAQRLAELKSTGKISLDVGNESIELDEEDIQIGLQAKQGWAAAQGSRCVVVLSTELTDELIRAGLARDIIRVIQEQRKNQDCDFTDRIRAQIATQSPQLSQAIRENHDYIAGETLAQALKVVDHVDGERYDVGGEEIRVKLDVEPT